MTAGLRHFLSFTTLPLLAALLLNSCHSSNQEAPLPLVTDEVTLHGLSDRSWTYFSFETGAIIGTSTFLSEEEDKAWARRDDWDFAICGDRLKTNSGTSGIGNGGILRDQTTNFQLLDTAPEKGYSTDLIQEVE